MLTANEYYELIQLDRDFYELQLLNAYDDFWSYCLYMDYEFFTKRRVILEEPANDMQNLILPKDASKELDILNVSLPPRSGKSYLCTMFCTWAFGRLPKESILRNTVTARLYNKFSRDGREIIAGNTHKARYKNVFANIRLKTESLEGWEIEGSKQGISYFGAGFEGNIIGFGASLLSIVDDSIGDEFTAMSEYQLDKKWDWYTSAQDSREEKGCKKLFIGTRWSKKDIVGRLEEKGFFEGSKAKSIVVPALINGKSYCEEVHTTKKLLEKKKITSDFIWLAEWMQEPVEAKGLVFPPDELKRFELSELKKKPNVRIGAGDIADEGTDFLSIPIADVYNDGDKVYIIDVKFTNEPIEITQPETAAYIDKYNPSKVKFESNNGGKGFAMEVKRLKTKRTHVIWERTTQNKHTRIIMKSGQVKEHFYFRDDYEAGSDYDKFMRQLITYNKRGTAKQDDAADSVTMLAEMLYDTGPGIRITRI